MKVGPYIIYCTSITGYLPLSYMHVRYAPKASHFGPSAKLIQAEKEMEAKYRAANLAAAGGESEV